MADEGLGGWTKAYRRRWDHPVFKSMQEAAVWAWMCDIAQFETHTLRTKWGEIELRRGEVLVSQRLIEKEFGLGRQRVRDLLTRMETTHSSEINPMIKPVKNRCPHRAGTIYQIVNYNKYQDSSGQRTLALTHSIKDQPPGKNPNENPKATQEQEYKINNTTTQGENSKSGGEEKQAVGTQIIQAFDTARVEAFGQGAARAWPGAQDIGLALNWVTAGADVKLCLEVFRDRMFTMASGGRSAPAFQYFNEIVTQAVAARNRVNAGVGRIADPDSTEAHRDRGVAAAERLREKIKEEKEHA